MNLIAGPSRVNGLIHAEFTIPNPKDGQEWAVYFEFQNKFVDLSVAAPNDLMYRRVDERDCPGFVMDEVNKIISDLE
jgi:hypothetical protein